MANAIRTYSSLFHCLHDEPDLSGRAFGAYSIFRAIDGRDIEQKPAPPHVHDFAVLWDDDHDTRIIPLIEELLMAGILPGVQFIGEHKGTLTIILAARTYGTIDVDAFTQRVSNLTVPAAGDSWYVEVGMIDLAPGNLGRRHQCDFKELTGLGAEDTQAFLTTLSSMWRLGTKRWVSADTPALDHSTGKFFSPADRYFMGRGHLARLPSVDGT